MTVPFVGTIRDYRTFKLERHNPQYQGVCLSANGEWITWNSENLVWLPSEYRPWCSDVSGRTFDRPSIARWFERLHRVIAEYGIQSDDILNFDEIWYHIGVAGDQEIVTFHPDRVYKRTCLVEPAPARLLCLDR